MTFQSTLEAGRTYVRFGMESEQARIREFMTLAQQDIPDTPCWPDYAVRTLRLKLIEEEVKELESALVAGNIEDVMDALADLTYVLKGAYVAFGVDGGAVFDAVHNANMRKFGPGSYKREDGKWMKPPDWQPPDLIDVLAAQAPHASAVPNGEHEPGHCILCNKKAARGSQVSTGEALLECPRGHLWVEENADDYVRTQTPLL